MAEDRDKAANIGVAHVEMMVPFYTDNSPT
jgi:hypothetical protein